MEEAKARAAGGPRAAKSKPFFFLFVMCFQLFATRFERDTFRRMSLCGGRDELQEEIENPGGKRD